jgi:hypothetical protein
MLIVALVLAIIGLAALVAAVVTSNELIAWVCIAASVIGVVLLIVDALRERSRGEGGEDRSPTRDGEADADYPDDETADEEAETSSAAAETADGDAAEDRNTR